MGDRFDVFSGRPDPDADRIDRLLPGYGRLSDITELADLAPGPEPLKLLAAWTTWAERIRRQSITPEHPQGRTQLYLAIQTVLMGSMAQKGRRNQAVLQSLIAAHAEQLDGGGYGGLAPIKHDAKGKRSAKQILRDEAKPGLRKLDDEAGEM